MPNRSPPPCDLRNLGGGQGTALITHAKKEAYGVPICAV